MTPRMQAHPRRRERSGGQLCWAPPVEVHRRGGRQRETANGGPPKLRNDTGAVGARNVRSLARYTMLTNRWYCTGAALLLYLAP